MHKVAFFTFGICIFLNSAAQSASKPGLPPSGEVIAAEQKFADELAHRGTVKSDDVMAVLNKARYQQSVIDTMTRPAESKPWKDYRPIFVNDRRIDDGA